MSLLNTFKYKIFGKPACVFCAAAVDLLNARGIQYEYINVLEDPASLALMRARNFTTVPQIYQYQMDDTGEIHIGGFTELKAYLNNC